MKCPCEVFLLVSEIKSTIAPGVAPLNSTLRGKALFAGTFDTDRLADSDRHQLSANVRLCFLNM